MSIEIIDAVMTKKVSMEIPRTVAEILVTRHSQCDWGDLCEDDVEAQNEGMAAGLKPMCMSVFKVNMKNGEDKTIWVITDRGHQTTTVLFPEEY